jgi:hypothetical protein
VLAFEIVVEFKFKGGGIEGGGVRRRRGFKGGGSLKEEGVRRKRQFKGGGSLKEEGVIKGRGGGGKGGEVKGQLNASF